VQLLPTAEQAEVEGLQGGAKGMLMTQGGRRWSAVAAGH